MQITILRHGEPDFDWQRGVKGSDMGVIISAYDASGIIGNPPDESLGLVAVHNCIVCSDLVRSIQSAKALGADSIHESSSLFSEMNLPCFDKVQIKLPLKAWAVILRLLWYVGFSKNTESLSEAKTRAKEAAQKLIALAGEHQSVLLVGHGFLNHYVVKELRRRNWAGPHNAGKQYWEYGTYTMPVKSLAGALRDSRDGSEKLESS